MAQPTRILIADDQDDIRSGFRLVLDAQPDMKVVGEARNGVNAVDLARHIRPDVVIADIRMPQMDGLEVTRRLTGPGVPDPIKVIVVTTFDLDEYVTEALQLGACGFLLKRSGPTLLIESVRAAMAGDTLIQRRVRLFVPNRDLVHRLPRPVHGQTVTGGNLAPVRRLVAPDRYGLP